MQIEERKYSALLVSASETFNTSLQPLFSEAGFIKVHTVSNISSAQREYAARAYDFVIVNAPLPDDMGIRFATEICNSSSCIVLLLVREELYAQARDKVMLHGVFTLAKPITKPVMRTALSWMAVARERMRKTEKKTMTIEEKMAEIRLINRAKWLLIEQEKMTEPEAHRFIEKQAMDRCLPRRTIAEEILNNNQA